MIKNPPASAREVRDISLIPGSGRYLEKGMATHSSSLAWRIPWTEKPRELQFLRLQRVGEDGANNTHAHTQTHTHRHTHTDTHTHTH